MISRSLPLTCAAIALIAALSITHRKGTTVPAGASHTPIPRAPTHAPPGQPATDQAAQASRFRDFRDWLSTHGATAASDRAVMSEGVKRAAERRNHMVRLIRTHPEQALGEALSYAEWDALPPEIRAQVETPFSATVDYHFYPVCGDGGPLPPGVRNHLAEIALPDGKMLEAFVYGEKLGHMSKRRLPVQGIALDGAAALRPETLQAVSGADLAAVRRIYRPQVAAGSGPVHAIAGGSLLAFPDDDALAAANERLARAESRPGPVAAASYLLPDGDGEIDWSQLETFTEHQASQWTETEKDVFIIRVNFTDHTAEPFTQAAVSSVMNGVVSESILAMSYGKTWINATVSANLYTLPETAAYYSNGGTNSLNSALLRDARNVFRTTRTGADAAINIGPVNNSGSGGGGGLGDFDIVGITFSSIGMASGSVTYAGLAGGGDLWMQGSNSARVFIHEFGHNYGIGHSSSWDVTSGNPVDPAGTSTEYGDIYDIMGSGPVPTGHFHAQAKAKLDWLTAAQWSNATAQGSDTYRIHRIDDAATTSSTRRGVRITKASSPAEYYWLSYRPAFLSSLHQNRGVYLTWERPGQGRCWLVDTTPGTDGGKNDSALTLGRTYSDAAAHVHVTPLALGGTGADRWVDVRVNLGPFPGNLSPAAQPISGPASVPARSPASYSATATDPDGDPLAWHWNSHDGLVHDNSPTLTHSWLTGGAYPLAVTASDMKGGTHLVSTVVNVTDPLDLWTPQASGSTSYLRSSTWGKGRFVVCDLWGRIHTSWDGVSWEDRGALPGVDGDARVSYGNQAFVVVGRKSGESTTQIYHSPDARTWAAATFPPGLPLMRDLVFADGRFIAVGDGGNVLSSTDGITWSLTTVPGAPPFQRVAWDGTSWMALVTNPANSRTEQVWTSSQATHWTQVATLDFTAENVLARAGQFFVTGWYGNVAVSTDHGLTWSEAQMPGSTRWSTRQIALADDGTLLVGAKAMDESGQPQAWLVSTDGNVWARSQAGAGFAYDTRSLTYGAGRFLATADGGAVRTSGSFHPANSAPVASFVLAPESMPAREDRLFAATAMDADGDALIYAWDFGLPGVIVDGAATVKAFDFGGALTVTLRVSDGKGGLTTLTRNIAVSDPARQWVQRSSGTTNTLHAIAASPHNAVAVGGSGGIIRTSTDGVTWITRTVPEFASNITFRGAVWDGSRFVIVGNDYNFSAPAGWQACIYTSPDGITWTRRSAGGSTDRSNELYAVAAGNGGLIAVGNGGTAFHSADGVSWSPITLPGVSSVSLRGVSHGSGTWLIAGYGGSNGAARILTSADRVNWMERSTGAGLASWQDIRKTAYLHDRFVGSGWYSKLRTSTDEGTTFSTTRADSEETPALAYGGSIYFAAGVNRSDSNADVDLLSLDGETWTRAPAPTTDDRNGAAYFQHTFITVGAAGSIWQSANVTAGGTSANQPPAFAGYSTPASSTSPTLIPISAIVGAASDPDGDALILTSSATTSALGGAVVRSATTILYTPPSGVSATDSFQITITDARGAAVTGLVTLTVAPGLDISGTPLSLSRLAVGQIGLSFQGPGGQSYLVERSTDLDQWHVIATVTASPEGAVSHTDPTPPAGKAFYRLRVP